MSFIGLLETIGKGFEKGLKWAVTYAVPVEKLVALLFPAAAPAVTELADATTLIQSAVLLVEQKYAAAGVQQGTGAQKLAEVMGLKLSEAIAADALLPQTALDTPGSVLANLQQLQVVSSTGTALQLDAGTAPPAGGGFEVRRRDWDFGPGVDQDLVLRSPVRSFSIPREGQVERYYVRMFDASTPPVYSRFSSAVFTNLPVS
jgi:hypothetical protein